MMDFPGRRERESTAEWKDNKNGREIIFYDLKIVNVPDDYQVTAFLDLLFPLPPVSRREGLWG